MNIVSLSKTQLNPISLPGMGRSIELVGLSPSEVSDLQAMYTNKDLFVEFTEEPDQQVPVINIWVNPHSAEITLFIK
ncbi:MAG: hypothetical protein OWR52_01285 [Acidibacillus sp.]|uniref:Uncharacterized protein n=1 Tax=Sulfoacidibacillus ferrooxidans TaxID=2005001 RepID=A0A9X2ABX1_9BACL|nr:hypothetical protein [Sulfoacidibacillus ferrooxidans]MCI0183548.1 hypothetical protein [Sulfoacidibacillus ferrooxidans]MCY0892131.1 hypothetical protein [Acidibacillus sp.]